jgi:hypothetical protein
MHQRIPGFLRAAVLLLPLGVALSAAAVVAFPAAAAQDAAAASPVERLGRWLAGKQNAGG